MSKILVTKQSLQSMLDNKDPKFVMHVVGKALIGLFDRQTRSEQESNSTDNLNNIGFAGCDAKSGSLTAKFYLKNKFLEPWMVDKWTKRGSNGLARLCKYDRQLNEIAIQKQLKKGTNK